MVRVPLSSRCLQLALWCRVWVSHSVLLCPVLCLFAGTPRDARRSEVPREVWQGLGQVLQHREVPHRAVRVLSQPPNNKYETTTRVLVAAARGTAHTTASLRSEHGAINPGYDAWDQQPNNPHPTTAHVNPWTHTPAQRPRSTPADTTTYLAGERLREWLRRR